MTKNFYQEDRGADEQSLSGRVEVDGSLDLEGVGVGEDVGAEAARHLLDAADVDAISSKLDRFRKTKFLNRIWVIFLKFYAGFWLLEK